MSGKIGLDTRLDTGVARADTAVDDVPGECVRTADTDFGDGDQGGAEAEEEGGGGG